MKQVFTRKEEIGDKKIEIVRGHEQSSILLPTRDALTPVLHPEWSDWTDFGTHTRRIIVYMSWRWVASQAFGRMPR